MPPWLRASTWSAASRRRSGLRAVRTTSAPWARARRAVSRPMPELPPITTTVWPSRSCCWPGLGAEGRRWSWFLPGEGGEHGARRGAEHEVGGQVVAEGPRVVLPDRLVHLGQREDHVAARATPPGRVRARATRGWPGRPAGQHAVLDAPTDAGGPVREVRRGPGPAVGGRPGA